MLDGPVPEALTFDDVLLVPAKSEVLPAQVDTRTPFSRNIRLNIPLASAAMDTVADSRLAIALAQQGGIGIIHRTMSIERQASEIDKVKRSESGMIVDPVTIGPRNRIADALGIMQKYKISGVPVTSNGRLLGILTNRDLRFETRMELAVEEVMTRENLITVPVGTTLEEAEKILHRHRVEKLLVVDDNFNLKGLITAVGECARAARNSGVPIISDGGVKFSGDITKALAAGAHSVMIGSLFAGTEESPGETILFQGRSYKSYRGMGSIAAMREGSS